MLLPRGHSYPEQSIHIEPFPTSGDGFTALYPQPPGLVEGDWPPTQLTYLGLYLRELGCKTIIHETHYIDRDFIDDVALFYGRSLRASPNHCQRLHFLSAELSADEWRAMVLDPDREAVTRRLQPLYLGFSVVRPLPGAPVGRTVLRTYGSEAAGGKRRSFPAVRRYQVHLAGFELHIEGLAFQQQDQGVSACATTALWCAIQKVAPMEGLALVSPATITEAASRYVLTGGRALPSEGLTVAQICEATRSSGLAPVLVESTSPERDRAQLLAYLNSGFAPVLAIQNLNFGQGHAVCAVGVKLGEVQPQPDETLSYRDAGSALIGLYLHDDRLGPYASAELFTYTANVNGTPVVRTGLQIQWPDRSAGDLSLLSAIVIPVPTKLRLTVARMRELGHRLADAVGQLLPRFKRAVTLGCRYRLATSYRASSAGFGLSPHGLYELNCSTTLSRYVGMIELTVPGGPLLDVILDATESKANPAVLACVQRSALSAEESDLLGLITKELGARFIR